MVEPTEISRIVAGLAGTGKTLAVAESLTGGLLAAAVVSVPGASAVFRGGVVAYATELKSEVLGVDRRLLAERGPVDPEVAAAMAAGVARRLGADIGVSSTGVAGPAPLGDIGPGLVFVAVSDSAAGVSSVRGLQLSGDRNEIREQTVARAVELLAEYVLGE
mgnify:CR=1 FL=1